MDDLKLFRIDNGTAIELQGRALALARVSDDLEDCFGSTKRSLSAALVQMAGKDSEVVSRCGAMMRDAAAGLLGRA